MKKFLSILLAAATVIGLISPVFAVEEMPVPDIEMLSTQIRVTDLCARAAHDAYIDKETGEEIPGPEWTYYNWADTCRVSTVIGEETYENTRLSALADASSNQLGIAPISYYVLDHILGK